MKRYLTIITALVLAVATPAAATWDPCPPDDTVWPDQPTSTEPATTTTTTIVTTTTTAPPVIDTTTTTTTTVPVPPTTLPPVVIDPPAPERCTWPAIYPVGASHTGPPCSDIDPCIDTNGDGHGNTRWTIIECFTTDAARLWVTTVRHISATYGVSIVDANRLLAHLLTLHV